MDQNPNKVKGGKYTRTCIICGEEFRTNSKTRDVCYIPHTRDCCICGKPFPVNVYSSKTMTCSSKCASDLRVQRNLEKYGVKSTLQLEEVKEKIKQTCLEKYGVENVMASKEVQETIKQRNLEKYGVEWTSQRKDVRDKSKQTCLDRYGVEYGCISEQAKEKTKQTNLERYGVEHVFQSKEFRESAKESVKERYGTEYYVQSEDFKQKAQATWINNYGVDNPLKSKEIQQRGETTSLQKYGTRKPQQSLEIQDKIRMTNIQHKAESIADEETRERYLEFKQDPKGYLDKYILEHLNTTCSAISQLTGFEDNTIISNLLHKYGYHTLATSLSNMESCIYDYIKSLDPSINIILHDRTVIGPKELELYLPDYHLGIECNPTATHNSTTSLAKLFGNEDAKALPMSYHKKKSLACEDKGVFLFHIFGYEWAARPYVIQSMLRNLLGKNSTKYYARKLKVRLVDSKESNQFLDINHRQGSAQSSINLGLYSGEELISLMTFGHTRQSIGKSEEDDETCWELIRFCNKINTSVVGGASKLFKYFLRNYNYTKIVSFSDIAHTQGKLYETLGFQKVHTSEPGYVWVHSNTDLYLHRVSCQKQNLPKLFNEPDLDIKNKTEQMIMSEHGFVQVFDCGVIRWEYTV